MADIVFVDDYVEASGSVACNKTYELEKLLNTYLAVLRQVREKGIMEGETADAFESFIGGFAKYDGVLSNLGECAKRDCVNSVTRFDEADKYLY